MADSSNAKEQERKRKQEEKEDERKRKQEQKERERREKFDQKLKNVSNARRKKAEKALANRTAKLNKKRLNVAEKRAVLRGTLRNRVLAAAREEIADLNEKYVVIPEKGVAESRFQKYVNATKKRYYKNTKKLNPGQLDIKQRLLNAGINEKYIKIGARFKNYNSALAAARKRINKNSGKTQKSQHRSAILDFAQQSLGLDEKAVRSAVCIKQKK
jgi:hypothetical protein